MPTVRPVVTRVLLLLAVAVLLPAPSLAQTVPDGFTVEPVVAIERPTALAFFPSGDLLISSQPGVLHFLADGNNTTDVALDLTANVCATASERGLLGVAIHPNFGGDPNWIYLFYTGFRGNTCVNRVSRFRFTGGTADPNSEQVLIDNMPSTRGNHNGGDLQFGRDGHLYVSIGEAGVDTNAPRLNLLSGKILRITADGGIPAGNPFKGKRTSRCHVTGQTKPKRQCREIFAYGLRNPFRIAHDPNSGKVRFFINDVGAGSWEEINNGIRGANYGWPRREGPCKMGSSRKKDCGKPPKRLRNPIHAYKHETGCRTITGGAFVPRSAGWPAAFNGKYLFADFICGTIFRLDRRGRGFTRVPFVTGAGPVVHMAFSPDGSLYYTTFANNGQVVRIAPSG